MSVITIRLNESLLKELDASAHVVHVPRAEYVRRAIQLMNKKILDKERTNRLKNLSLKIRKESMKINTEFSQEEYDPEI